ncbi:uncharacterized protein AMSG_00148 [Thecamonas trahens ATCC 50062]|uniref:SGF29 C-terminal domain-containing protein n=1 Tax=Thecamonas trahens ATCC 50062 TaxID=461836 RepID=A0A0L0D1L7_THETB|nr:hypothetical protein AMSG_00148 [Thecamonas trahens ATCC 50062]KNC46030.1 hypothetical protein AMSG_00148 [Thecamonas trahens ATCC 50062]|eukprot:XP_013763010.1 hypothetical protein AMSG_00148 [Thecamonas trahens ATCC 50062]
MVFKVGDMVAARVRVENRPQWAMMKVSAVEGTDESSEPSSYVVVDLYPDSDDEAVVHKVKAKNMLAFPPNPDPELPNESGTHIYALWYENSDWSTVFYSAYVAGPSEYGDDWISVRYVGSRKLFDVPTDKVFRDPKPRKSASGGTSASSAKSSKSEAEKRKSGRKRKSRSAATPADTKSEGGDEASAPPPAKQAKSNSVSGSGARPRISVGFAGAQRQSTSGKGSGSGTPTTGKRDTAFALAMARQAEEQAEAGSAPRMASASYELGEAGEEIKLDSLLSPGRIQFCLKKKDMVSVLHKKRALMRSS